MIAKADELLRLKDFSVEPIEGTNNFILHLVAHRGRIGLMQKLAVKASYHDLAWLKVRIDEACELAREQNAARRKKRAPKKEE